ncbi:MAG: LOG family protein [Gemmatimonadota bacterium]
MATTKAYRDIGFLTSPDARTLRILAEYLEPESRFRRQGIDNIIAFFGSARARPLDEAQGSLAAARKRGATAERVAELEPALKLARYYEDARHLARRLTEWSMELGGDRQAFTLCSGGGPGIMEACNRGAAEAGGRSIGLNISLPHEQEPNPYITPELNLEFHYFFMRKLWFVHLACAMVIFPGGLGTLDEMAELLTLTQTGRSRSMPIVIYGSEYWKEVLSFDAMVRWGTIGPEDLALFRLADSPDEAFGFLREQLAERLTPG